MSESDYEKQYRYIWASEHDKWLLLKNRLGGYTICSVNGGKTTILKLEDNDAYHYVIRKMLESNCGVYTVEEFNAKYQ
jgi:hypothetical protein